ncbi:MAG: hypothetical protein JO110_21170 [Acetobacteraceae bacterium]|nr:hypothetical protein [Acetobacteraceae bacterium]
MPKRNIAFVVRQRTLNGAGIKPVSAWLRATAAAALISAAACSSQGGGPQAGVSGPPDGTVEMTQVQAAFIGSGGGGNGVLYFHGRSYPFQVAGLGIGGIGASTIQATGEVYGLQNVSQFPGAYAQGRYGFALGRQSAGDLWLKNDNGVTMHLHAKREGLMLSLGGDAVVIRMSPSAAGT